MTQFQHTLLLFIEQDSKHEVGTQAFYFPACVVSSGGHAPFCWIWYILSLSLQGQIGTGLDLFPKGLAIFLLEEEVIFQSQPGFSSLPALSSRMSTSAASLSCGSCSTSHSTYSRDGFGPSGPVF